MGLKKRRTGRITHTGSLPKYHYEDRDGISTLVRMDHVVQLVIEITDGPDAGREVQVELGTLEALLLSRNVDRARHEVHAKNRAHDVPETGEDDGYTAVSGLGKLERVPGTDTLRPARQTGAQRI